MTTDFSGPAFWDELIDLDADDDFPHAVILLARIIDGGIIDRDGDFVSGRLSAPSIHLDPQEQYVLRRLEQAVETARTRKIDA